MIRKTTKPLHKMMRGAELLAVVSRGPNSRHTYNIPGLAHIKVAQFTNEETGGVRKFIYYPSNYQGKRI